MQSNKTKAITGILLVLIIILISILFLINGTETQQKATIKMGAILPFTGSSSITGDLSRAGIDLAVEKTNVLGGIHGRKVEIIYEDSQTKIDAGLNAFEKLYSIDEIKFVFTSVSGVAMAIAPIANENKIIQMDVVSATPAYSTPNDFTFRTGANSYYFAQKMSKLLFLRKINEVSLFYVNSDYGGGFEKVFAEEFTSSDGKIISIENYSPGDTDFRQQLSKLMKYSPKTLVLISLQKETPLILKQMDELGFNVPIFTDVYAAELADNLYTEASKNITYLKPAVDFNNNMTAQQFRKDFLLKYKHEPDFISAQAFDGFSLLAKAMNACTDPENTTCVKEKLFEIRNYEGVIGANISFDENGDVAERKIIVMQIKDGNFIEAV